ISTWKASSASTSGVGSRANILRKGGKRAMSVQGRGVERGEHGRRIPFPVVGFRAQLRPPLARQGIKLRLAVVFGRAPVRRDPAALFKTMQRRIERAFADGERIVGGVLDPARDRVAVRGA